MTRFSIMLSILNAVCEQGEERRKGREERGEREREEVKRSEG